MFIFSLQITTIEGKKTILFTASKNIEIGDELNFVYDERDLKNVNTNINEKLEEDPWCICYHQKNSAIWLKNGILPTGQPIEKCWFKCICNQKHGESRKIDENAIEPEDLENEMVEIEKVFISSI